VQQANSFPPAQLPLQNGVEAADILAQVVGKHHVVGGFCKIISYIVTPGHIRHDVRRVIPSTEPVLEWRVNVIGYRLPNQLWHSAKCGPRRTRQVPTSTFLFTAFMRVVVMLIPGVVAQQTCSTASASASRS
jgi:hypothetical protein